MRVKPWLVALLGVVFVLLGFKVALDGSTQHNLGTAQSAQVGESQLAELLGVPGWTTADERAEAAENVSAGQTKSNGGVVMMVTGAVLLLVGVPLAAWRNRLQAAKAGDPGASDPVSVEVERRQCPSCGESIAVAARKCRFCSEDLTDPV